MREIRQWNWFRMSLGVAIVSLGLTRIGVAADTVIDVKMAEFGYVLSSRSAMAGHITFHLKNLGGAPHDFEIAGKNSGMIPKGGGTSELSVDLAPGTYGHHCTVPGHAEAGMKGIFQVQ
jgi:uncharacterized cupredoxin-like copper-binding protein